MTNTRWSDRDIENLFAGRAPANGDLARLAPLIDGLRKDADRPAPSAHVKRMARSLAEVAREGAARPMPRRARRAVRAPVPWRRRIVSVGGVVALATIGVGGVAVAANGAAPGDLLYSVDRAFEAVGIANGGMPERLDEAARLADEGDLNGALRHAADAVEAGGDSGTAGTLETTAADVTTLGSEDSTEVQAAVSDMLQWMAATDYRGRDFGQGVAERARAIGDSVSHGGDSSDTSQGTTGDTSNGTTGDTSNGNSGDTSHGNSGDTSNGNSGNGSHGNSDGKGSSPGGSRGN